MLPLPLVQINDVPLVALCHQFLQCMSQIRLEAVEISLDCLRKLGIRLKYCVLIVHKRISNLMNT